MGLEKFIKARIPKLDGSHHHHSGRHSEQMRKEAKKIPPRDPNQFRYIDRDPDGIDMASDYPEIVFDARLDRLIYKDPLDIPEKKL